MRIPNEYDKFGNEKRNSDYPIKNLTEFRKAFWDAHPEFADQYRKHFRQNEYEANIRMAWVDFVDRMEKSGQVSRRVAKRAIL